MSKQIRIRIYENINNLENISIQTLLNSLLSEYNNNRNLRKKINKTLAVKDGKVYKNDN